MSALEEAHNQSALIGQLHFNMDYLSYHLLDHLVGEFHLEGVRVQMEAYKSDLERFRKKTPLDLFCDTRKGRRGKSLADFQKIVAEFQLPTGASNTKLEMMDRFQQEYITHYNLKECSMVLSGIEHCQSTIKCTWLIPHSVTDKLKKKLPRVVFKSYHLDRLAVAGACVYRHRQVSHLFSFLSDNIAIPSNR